MTNVFRVFDHYANLLEVADQEWRLAEQNFTIACKDYSSLDPRRQDKFRAAVERRAQAREIWCTRHKAA